MRTKINSLSNLPIVYTVLFLGLYLVILCFIQNIFFEGLNLSIKYCIFFLQHSTLFVSFSQKGRYIINPFSTIFSVLHHIL